MRTVLIIAACILIVPFLLLCGYIFPVNDDFLYAARHIGVSPWEAVVECWKDWSGRYLAVSLSSANPLAVDKSNYLTDYRWIAAATILSVAASWVFTPLIAFRNILGRNKAISLGCLFFLIFMSLTENTAQLFYWFSAITAYTIPAIIIPITLSLTFKKGLLITPLLCCLSLLIPGGNEISAIAFVCSLFYLAYAFPSRRLNAMCICACIGILFVIFAPGNGERMGFRLSTHPYLWACALSGAQTLSWAFRWLPVLIVATAIYLPLAANPLSKLLPRKLRVRDFTIFTISTIFLAHIPPTLGLGTVITDRTANALLQFFILFYFFGFTLVVARHPRFFGKLSSLLANRKLQAALLFCFLFIAPFALESPATTAVLDLVAGKAKRYSEVQTQRLMMISDNSGSSPIVLPEFGTAPKSIFLYDLMPRPDAEFPKYYATFYRCSAPLEVPSDSYDFDDNLTTIKSIGKSFR